MAKKISKAKTESTPKKVSKKPRAPKSRKASEVEVIEPQDDFLDADKEVIDIGDPDLRDDEALLAPPKKEIVAAQPGLVSADALSRYMAEIRKYPLLTREEEHSLAVKYRETGDREAAQKLVTSNLRFVVKIALEYTKFGAKLIDLVQEGNVGLMQAVKEFNPYKGVRLISYAVWWIRGYIQDFLLRHYSMVRMGTTHNQRKLFYELQRSRDQLERMGMEAGFKQISGRLGIPEDEVKEMSSRVFQRDISIDKPVGDDERSNIGDFLSNQSEPPADEALGRHEEISILHEKLEQIRPQLNPREVFVLENRLLADEPLTLQEIGDKYGITREAARQMESRLMDKIKRVMTEV